MNAHYKDSFSDWMQDLKWMNKETAYLPFVTILNC